MKRLISFLYVFGLALSSLSVAAGPVGPRGNWTGSGGDGYALMFTSLGYRLHREMLMEKYQPKEIQARDEIPMDKFLAAVDSTKVIVSTQPVYDKHGHEQTAVYFTVAELRQLYTEKGWDKAQIDAAVADLPNGMIVVNEARFKNEVQQFLGSALATVFHEYGRVMGLDENNYRTLARSYDVSFFTNLANHSSATTRQTFAEVQAQNQVSQMLRSKIDVINAEKGRVKAELREDIAELEVVLAKRLPIVKAMRGTFTQTYDAYADMLDSVSMFGALFPSASAPLVRSLGDVMDAQMQATQKLSELEVVDMQMAFLKGNVQRNSDFYAQIDTLGKELFKEDIYNGLPADMVERLKSAQPQPNPQP